MAKPQWRAISTKHRRDGDDWRRDIASHDLSRAQVPRDHATLPGKIRPPVLSPNRAATGPILRREVANGFCGSNNSKKFADTLIDNGKRVAADLRGDDTAIPGQPFGPKLARDVVCL